MPKLTSVTINYNSSIKINIGNYESYSLGDSETRTYDVSDLTEVEADEFIAAAREGMVERIDDYIETGYDAVRKKK